MTSSPSRRRRRRVGSRDRSATTLASLESSAKAGCPASSALTWRNGQPAGRLRATSINLASLIEDGDRRCFVSHDLELCASAENVKSFERPSAPATPEESPQSVSETESETKAIQRTIRSNASVFTHCYETQLKKNPALEGKVVVRFTTEANGLVSRVQIDDNTTNNANLSRCLRKKFKHLKFPGRETSAEVSYPFVFATAG